MAGRTTDSRALAAFRGAGPALLLAGCFFGVFSRGLVNASFALLALWALAAALFFRRRLEIPAPPRPYLWGLGLYLGVVLLTSIFSGNRPRSFFYLADVAYILASGLAAWAALGSSRGRLPRLMPACWGAGLFFWLAISLKESGLCFACLRAKADLGVIDSGAVLAQIVPLMMGALALALDSKNKRLAAFFILAGAAGVACLYLNCARIALISAPPLALMMFAAFRRSYGKILAWIIIAAAALGAAAVLSDERVTGRFRDMFVSESESNSNRVRFVRWRRGADEFLKHPALGAGPAAVPNASWDDLPEGERGGSREGHPEYYHAHHVALTILAESGVVGMAGFLALHLLPLWYIWPHRRSPSTLTRFYVWASAAVFLQFVLNGLTDHIFTLRAMMYVYWTVTAAAMFVASKERAAALGAASGAAPGGREAGGGSVAQKGAGD